MPQKTNLNVAPYYDDFDSDKNFYKVLFRPGYSVQTRELTSLQSILQGQIERYGKFLFKQGQQVIPGAVSLNTRLDYVKLSSVSEVAVNENDKIVYKKYDIKLLVNTLVRGINSGVVAKVLQTDYGSDIQSDTLFVKYENSGDSNDEATFRQGETLEVVDGINTPLLVVGTDGSALPTSINVTNPISGNTSTLSSPAMGFSTAVDVEEGVYFVNGFFVQNSKQLLVVDKYYNQASAKVGFTVNEEVITPENDASLYDNARGYSNASAPGAHRLAIDLELSSYGYDADPAKNFIQLLKIKNGIVEKQVKTADYSLLEETLARRTYDESGDYVVNDFDLSIREFYQTSGNNGVYELSDATGLVNGYSAVEAEGKMMLSVGSGKAYVKGYEIVNKETKDLEVDKGRDTLSRDNITIKSAGMPEFTVTNVHNSVPLNNVGDVLTGYPTITLNSVFNDGSIGLNGLDNISNNFDGTPTSKKTIGRRSQTFSVQDGIKTIYIQKNGTFPTFLSDIPDTFYVVTQRGTGTLDGKPLTVLAKSIINRKEIDPASNAFYIELTVSGERAVLDTFCTEYDKGRTDRLRCVYDIESEMKADSNNFYGTIRDYNETITPVIGLAKPKNFRLKRRGVGFNQDSDIVLSKGRVNTLSPYNATFGFSYFNPTFFTRLTLDTNITNNTFTKGKYIYGKTSKAYGVIENDTTGNYSSGNKLFVTTLYGEFIPGETILDEDENAIKIAKENTLSHFIVNQRGDGYTISARVVIDGVTYDQSKIAVSTYGGTVTGVEKNRDIGEVELLDQKLRNIVYYNPPSISFDQDSNAGVQPAVITAVLFKDTVFTYTPQNVKSFGSTFNNYKFTADIDLTSTEYALYDQVTDFTFFGDRGTKFIECNGFGADISGFLVQGDIVQFSDSTNTVLKAVVQRVTQPLGVEKSRIYLDLSLPNDVVNATIIRLRPRIANPSASLVFPTGSKQVASVVSDSGDTKFNYYIRKDFVTEMSSGGGGLTFTAQLPVGTQRFVNFNENSFIVTVLDKGSSPIVQDGDIIYIDSKYITLDDSVITASTVTAGALRIKDLPFNYFGDIPEGGSYPTLKLTATVEIRKARPRLKTSITNKKVVVISSGDRVIPIRGQDYESDAIETVSYADCYKLRKVFEGTKTNPPSIDKAGNLVSGTDITYKFDFDDGQRDTHYDVSRIILKPGFDSPTGQIVVIFDYFEHSLGDFCTVDSYSHEAGIASNEIPLFNSEVNGVVPLRDCIDFRPKVDINTTVTGFQDNSIISLFNTEDYISFVGTSGIPAATPAPVKENTNISYTMSFSEKQYLDRIDGLFLTKKGDFTIKKGNSSLNPAKPDPIEDAVALCYLHIPAYTNSSKDVRIVPVDNKRYTMKDIGKLEKRIERLEYYTTLSILEQQALNTQVKDNLGLEKTKTGFLVDNFESHGIGNLKSIDYKCAIDTQQSVLRAQSKEDSLILKEINTRDDQREADGYVINNKVVTLPFTEVELLSNKNATKTINPNPFVVIQYVGESVIIPQQDSWYDQSVAPLISDSNTKLNSIFLAKENNLDEAYGSIHNSFIINWVGSTQSFFNIESFANINTEDIQSSVQVASTQSSSNVSPQNNEIGKGLNTKSIGDKKISSSVQFFARSIPVKFTVNRLKPNTKVNVFMEGRGIGAWVVPDSRFTGIGGNSLTTFGADLVTDSNGNLSGIIVIPAGLPPVQNSLWTGNVDTVSYQEGSEEVRFTTGIKTIRFISNEDNDKNTAVTYAEVKFYASGSLPQNPPSIVSTSTAFFKANEGVQLTDSNTEDPIKPNPLAQTFKIENFDGGVMATSVDLFFKSKSSTIPLRAYLTDVSFGKPGKNIIPGTQVSLNPETYLKVYVTGENDTIVLTRGEFVTGATSNASGPIDKIFDGSNVRVGDDSSTTFQLNKEQVYTLVLSNHNGTSFVENELLSIPSITQYNNSNNTTQGVYIARDSGRVTALNLESVGDGYDSASIVIESPQLPGGSTATGSVSVSDGKIYNSEISLSGRGYTTAPSVVIRGVGNSAAGAFITAEIVKDTPAVIMGIAVDNEGVTESTTPTRFKFKYPVYLSNNTEYALAIETDSLDYEIWASKLGETEIATSNEVTTQPSLGSVYKSQNTDNWTEDLFEDIKFTLNRAEFVINQEAELKITTESLGYQLLNISPFETSVRSQSNATSSLFKNNNNIVKVYHRNHGFEDSGASYVFFSNTRDVGGISSTTLNGRLFTISNSGLDTYNIVSPIVAGSSVLGGGDKVIASYNRKYEKLYAQIPYLELDGTKLETFVSTTNIIPVDSSTINYNTYDISSYERTFLNEEHFFINQKVITSDINAVMNEIDNSLKYKMILSSTNSALSPLIDLNTASVKTISNRIENATGYEDRFGKRDQILRFLSKFDMVVSVISSDATKESLLNQGATLTGRNSNAQGTVQLKDSEGDLVVNLRTDTEFEVGEQVTVTDTQGNEVTELTVTITSSTKIPFEFSKNANLIAYNPQDTDVSYTNRINGNIVQWDSEDQVLVVENCYQPINNNYTSSTSEIAFSRQPVATDQLPDIFRVGDVVQTTAGDPIFVEISSVEYTTGIDYISEEDSTNSSSVAKYVTKEISINNPGNSINVKTTVNTTDIENVKLYYKIKSASSSINFNDTNWIPFNINGNPDNDILATPANSISGQFEKQEDYQELSYTADDLIDFSSFAIKIVMKTDNPSYVPKIQDLRAIASF